MSAGKAITGSKVNNTQNWIDRLAETVAHNAEKENDRRILARSQRDENTIAQSKKLIGEILNKRGIL